jgi:hypothetical protein
MPTPLRGTKRGYGILKVKGGGAVLKGDKMIGKDIFVTCSQCNQKVTATVGGFVYAHKTPDSRWPAHLWPACDGSNKIVTA